MDGLPVESGPSLFDSSKNAFYFLKTINYSDYYNTATGVTTTKFQAKFKTTRDGTTSAAGTNATDFRVLDKVQTERNRTEPYFEYAECYVSVGGPGFKLVESSVSVKADATTATLQLRSNTSGTWTLTPSANVTELSQTTGTGNATVTVTFPANTDESAAKTYTVTATLDEAAAATIEDYTPQVFTITQTKKTNAYYTVNLNPLNTYNWAASTVNPDSGTYYSYQSEGNYNINSDDGGWFSNEVISIATMSVTIVGYTEFTIYIRSYAESSYDYVVVRKLDESAWTTSWSSSSVYSDSGTKAYTRDNQQSGTALSNYTAVTFTSADGLTNDDTPHTFYIQYGKDSVWSEGDDRGYVLIPKEYTFVSQ